ncbi:GGDEF domain-containing protein [Clostridium intestinale]|uniref:GGDEF domain-containing protein n=1 Tax=Clostridium intestinale TaxID=36845 RepID=A0A7D7AER7_9CLOT|nr:GGDEF domain-containing protein [Clostridium intestinale]QLY80664.1 GGDEF domain-containing protein [Clostridium intestinale]
MFEFRKLLIFIAVAILLFYMIKLLYFTKKKWPLESYTFVILIGGISLITLATFLDLIRKIFDHELIDKVIKGGFTLGAIIYIIGIILWSNFTKTMMNKLEKSAITDYMTGILNRNGIERIYDSVAKEKNPFFVIVCDLDGTKMVNDTYGHIEGDYYIDESTKIIANVVGLKGHVSRIGGDEFVILLSYTTLDVLNDMIKSIKKRVSDIYSNENLGISVGYSTFPRDGKYLTDLIKVADKNMYEDKKSLIEVK